MTSPTEYVKKKSVKSLIFFYAKPKCYVRQCIMFLRLMQKYVYCILPEKI